MRFEGDRRASSAQAKAATQDEKVGLAEQLRAINALLSVRPDHGSTASAIAVNGPQGQALVLSGTKVKLAPPTVIAPIADGEIRELAFGSEIEALDWVKRQKAVGVDVRLMKKEWQTRYFTEPMHIPLSFGGSEGLRAAGYIALTFFAHHFPELARCNGLDAFKRYVLGKDDEQLVWWETEDGSGQTPENPFRFGHTIEVAVSSNARRASARVSLFSTLTFSMELGEVNAGADATVATHIDPLARPSQHR